MKPPSLKQTAEAIMRAPGVSPKAKAEILALSIQGVDFEMKEMTMDELRNWLADVRNFETEDPNP